MNIIKDLRMQEILFIDNNQIRLKMCFVPSYFIFDFSFDVTSNNPIIINEENDYYLYNNFKWLLNQNYYFEHQYSYKNNNKIEWLSEHYFNIEDEQEIENTPRLIIEYKDNSFLIYQYRPFFEKNNIRNDSIVSLSPAGNGFLSKNIDSNLSFQDDMINIFYNSLNNKLISEKTIILKKQSN